MIRDGAALRMCAQVRRYGRHVHSIRVPMPFRAMMSLLMLRAAADALRVDVV